MFTLIICRSFFPESLEQNQKIGSELFFDGEFEEVILTYNLLSFFCLTVELYFAAQLHSNCCQLSFSERFSAASNCYQANRSSLPVSIKTLLTCLLESCAQSMEK